MGVQHSKTFVSDREREGEWERERERRGREGEGTEKIFEEIIIENVPKMGKEIATQVQEAQRGPGSAKSCRQDKPKEKHTKTHSN